MHAHQDATKDENAAAPDDAIQDEKAAAPDVAAAPDDAAAPDAAAPNEVAPVDALQEEADREEGVAGDFSARACIENS